MGDAEQSREEKLGRSSCYEQAKAAYLSWLDDQLCFAKRIHIDNDSYLEES